MGWDVNGGQIYGYVIGTCKDMVTVEGGGVMAVGRVR